MSDGPEGGAGYLRRDDPDRKSVVPPGVWVDDSDEDDPVLRNADGSVVDTWREDYPYAERMSREKRPREARTPSRAAELNTGSRIPAAAS